MKTLFTFFKLLFLLCIFTAAEAQLSGTYSIGTGAGDDYNTLFQALNDLQANGVDGPVIMELSADYDPGIESYPVYIQAYTGTSEINTITIKPAEGTSHLLQSSTASEFSAVFTVYDGSHFILDGSNNGTDSRDLLIINNAEINFTAPIALFDGGNPGTNVTVKNCELMAGSNQYSTAGIYSQNFSNVHFENNLICRTSIGIICSGEDIHVMNNKIGSDVESEYVNTAIGIENASNITVSGNRMRNMIAEIDDNVLIASYLINITGNCLYEKNRIDSVINTGTGTAMGLLISDCVPDQMDIVNNHISHIASDNFTDQIPNALGIDCSAMTSGMNIMYNSFSMDEDNSYGIGSALPDASSSVLIIAQGEGIVFKNNILMNALGERDGSPYSTTAYAIMCLGSTSPFADIDHNAWYTAGDNDYLYLAYANGVPMNLSDWQSFSGGDANSYYEDPLFISADSLQLQACSPAVAHAVYTSTVTDDIDGVERDTEYPTMGAYAYEKIQAENINLSPPVKGVGLLEWEAGNGCKTAVFMKEGNVLPETPLPVNGTTYNANENFGLGDEIGSTGWYCVYNSEYYEGVQIIGDIGEYSLMACEYYGSEGNEIYVTESATGNPNVGMLGSDMNELKERAFSIHPNPSTGNISVEIDRSIISISEYDLQIVDITGKEVFVSQNTHCEKVELNLSQLKKGIYFIQLKNSATVYIKKLILN